MGMKPDSLELCVGRSLLPRLRFHVRTFAAHPSETDRAGAAGAKRLPAGRRSTAELPGMRARAGECPAALPRCFDRLPPKVEESASGQVIKAILLILLALAGDAKPIAGYVKELPGCR
jgi:hypothetical protein